MMNTFLHCKTKWMWLISDDDVICDNAFDLIFQEIKKNSDACYLKFSTDGIGNYGVEKDYKVNNFKQFIDYYYYSKVKRNGNLIFVSNGVFNLTLLSPFLGNGFEYSYTYIPYLIPIFMFLDSENKKTQVKFSDKKIIKYNNPGHEYWSYKKVGLGLSTLSHIGFSVNEKYISKLLKITNPISYISMFLFLSKNDDQNRKKIYSLLYHNSYKFYLKFHEKIIYQILLIGLNFNRFSLFVLKNLKKL